MTLQTMCMGCMQEKGTAAVCPQCGFDEGKYLASPLYLPLRTLLQARYVVGHVLGVGGFGITYLSWDSTLALRVAIKEFLPRHLAARSTDGVSVSAYQGELAAEFAYGLEQFLEEARLLARFAEHPGIVAVRDFFTTHHTGYLVMNYLDGVTLHNYLARQGGRIPFHQALAILIPVMDTLQEVHVAGLLHRDISPDNIFLPTDKLAKLIDFGAARAALGERSRSLSVIIKPGYAPEEQYRLRGQQGPWTDVYALGATLYCALTGEPPPAAPDRLYQDMLKPLAALGVVLPQAVEAALLKALAVGAEQRFQTVGEFQAALLWGMEEVGGASTAPAAVAPAASAAPPPQPTNKERQPDPPEVLKNRYRLEEKIGQSKLGATFLAVDQNTYQPCLIKQFSLQQAGDWKDIELFERAAETLKYLRHPHIPKYRDYFTGEGQYARSLFLVREYIPGKTLAQWIADGRHFSEPDVIAIARVLAEVLCYLHQFSPPLIHRDIKPSNILLSEDEKIYLIDFGAVQNCLKLGGGSTMAGTFDYMPPEQRKGKTVPASDIYSLGATLIHLLSRLPLSQLQEEDLRLQFRSHVNISRELGVILEKMVEPRLERRYRTAADLLIDLHNLEMTARQGLFPRFSKRFLVTGLVVGLIIGSTIGLSWRYRGKPTTALPQPPVTLQFGTSREESEVPIIPNVEQAMLMRQQAIVEAFVRSASMKMAVTEFLQMFGKLPNSNAELGLPEPVAYGSTFLETLSVLPDGMIEAKFNRDTVGGGTVYLKPTINPADGFIEWQCVSPDVRKIASMTPACAYNPSVQDKK